MVGTGADLLATWSEASTRWLMRLDDSDLPRLIDEALARLVPFDQSVTFAYPRDAGPLLLFDGLDGTAPAHAMAAYLNGTHLLDPFSLACRSGLPCGLYRMKDCAPDAYFESEYFHSWEVHPCISMESGSLAEEIAYLFRLPCGSMAAYSLMRRNGRPCFDERDLTILRAVEPVVRQVLGNHWRIRADRDGGGRGSAEPVDGRSDGAFASFAADRLTRQQRRIVQLVLRGHSNASVGHHLGITEGTVKNHRHAIYERLGVGTQAELFALFVRHLSAGTGRGEGPGADRIDGRGTPTVGPRVLERV